jgi:hypothetical protein
MGYSVAALTPGDECFDDEQRRTPGEAGVLIAFLTKELPIMSRVVVIASILALAVPTIGCAGSPPPPAPPPPEPTAEAEVVVETEPPPPPPVQVEVVPPPPSVEYFWTPCYHRWVNGRYVWVTGRYVRRPYATAAWAPAHWEVRGSRHFWIEGRWR